MNIPLTSLIYFPKSYQQWLPDAIKSFHLMLNNTSETIFFPSTVTDVNNIQILELVSTFKKQILEFLKSNPDSVFMCTIFMESNCLQDYG